MNAKEELHQERMQFEESSREKKQELDSLKSELAKKENEIASKNQSIADRLANLDKKEIEIEKQEDYLAETIAKQISELERVAQMSRDEAKTMLLEQLKDELANEQVQLIRENEIKIKETAEEKDR